MHRSMRFALLALFVAVAPTTWAQDTSATRSTGRSVTFHFQLIAAVNAAVSDPAIADVDSVLHRLFRFAGYRLLAQASTTAIENERFSLAMSSSRGERYDVVGTASALGRACDTVRLALPASASRGSEPLYVVDGVVQTTTVRSQPIYVVDGVVQTSPRAGVAFEPSPVLPLQVQLFRGATNTGLRTSLLSTGITVPVGHTVVLGSAEPAGDAQALILTVRPDPVVPRCPPARVKEIDNDEIESVEVLKGAAAISLYGASAANGVVTITTKRGRGRPPELAGVPLATPPAATTRAATPNDVASADAIVAALYDVISGPAGAKRDWDRFSSLFAPGARLIPTGRGPDGKARLRTMTPDEYAAAAGPGLERNGFFEREIARTSESFGNITHAFSTYESRRAASDSKPFARGINSIQLLNDGTRWWVVTVYWDSEREGNAIPRKYLKRSE